MLNSSDYVTVIGGATIDITGFVDSSLNRGVSNPGAIDLCTGGVARNVAENLARLGIKTRLMTAVGNDLFGDMI